MIKNNNAARSNQLRPAAKKRARQNVRKKPTPSDRTLPKLERTTFTTSREMDFFNEKELTTQTAHPRDEWPSVILKELVDNAIDACEDHDIAPQVTIKADSQGITVTDNGPGLPESTLVGALDFRVRYSSREMYVSPCRGSQGNALMTLLAMPYVLDPDNGKVVIEVHGVRHEISCRCDPISQRPVVDDQKSKSRRCKGTSIRIQWSERLDDDGDDTVWPFDHAWRDESRWSQDPEELRDSFFDLVYGYAFFNPHLTLTLDWFGEKLHHFKASDPKWAKWKPNKPTSPHWYDQRHIERLIAAYITKGRDDGTDRTVSDFLTEFEGLAGTKKRCEILDETGMSRVHLSELTNGDGLDHGRISNLLVAMKRQTKPVIPKRLGVIGEGHFRTRFEGLGGVMDSFRYDRQYCIDNDIPCVVESAFCYRGEESNERLIYGGVNWSAAIGDPFRSLGSDGLGSILAKQRVTYKEPVIIALHLAKARVEFKDRGKSEVVLTGTVDEEGSDE